MEITLGWFQGELVLLKDPKDPFDVINVQVHGGCEYEDVIDINDNAAGSEDRIKENVHYSLECGRRIAQSKEHYLRNETSERGKEGGSISIFGTDSYIVESPSDI